MYQNEHSDRMVFFTDFNINPILLLSKKFTHAQMKNKPKSHDFDISHKNQTPAVDRHMSVTGG